MPKWLDNLLESSESKKERQLKELSQTPEFRELLKEHAAELIQESKDRAAQEKAKEEAQYSKRLEDAEESISLLSEDMQNSSKPHVIIRSLDFSTENGIEVKLDYNPAFIKYLAANGIEGPNEDDVIRRWLAHLSDDIMQQTIAEDYLMNGVSDDEKPDMGLGEVLEEIERQQLDDEDELNN